jgi:signal transduction histidine kinase
MSAALTWVRARLSLLALLAIAVPAAIVAALGWVSLRHWQASAELLFREQARDMAAMAVDKIEMTLRETENRLVAELQGALEARGPLAGRLDAFLAGHPLVHRLYLFDRRRGELLYPGSRDESDAVIFARLLAEVSQGFWEGGGRRELTGGDQIALAAILRGADGRPLLATLTWDVEVLSEAILARTVRTLEAPTILAVLDARDRPIFSKDSLAGADRVLTVPFRERLATWRLAVYQPPGDSPRQAVRRQVMLFMCAFGVLLVVIAAGTVLTWRLTRREAEMAQLKSDFVANVSHDLKTPLSVIRMFGETLEMGRVTDEARRQEYYGVIARESERLSRLIENVLDFARIEGGRRTYSIVPTAVEPVICDTLEAFSHPLASESFKVEVRVSPDLPEVPMDGEAIAQALSNLVDNAIKYSAERKALAVEARLADGELARSVADTGVGIPREEQSRIFEKFFRAGRSETRRSASARRLLSTNETGSSS